MENEICHLNLEDIIPNIDIPQQKNDYIEQELVESIKKHGIIQPIIVKKNNNKYDIVDGNRRYFAAKQIGLNKIPAIVKNNYNDVMKVDLKDNLYNSNISPIEEAKKYKDLLEKNNLTQEELANSIGKSQSALANKLRLLNLPIEIQEALNNYEITERHARSLLTVKNYEQQLELLKKIKEEKITVRELDSEIKNMSNMFIPEEFSNKNNIESNNIQNNYVENNSNYNNIVNPSIGNQNQMLNNQNSFIPNYNQNNMINNEVQNSNIDLPTSNGGMNPFFTSDNYIPPISNNMEQNNSNASVNPFSSIRMNTDNINNNNVNSIDTTPTPFYTENNSSESVTNEFNINDYRLPEYNQNNNVNENLPTEQEFNQIPVVPNVSEFKYVEDNPNYVSVDKPDGVSSVDDVISVLKEALNKIKNGRIKVDTEEIDFDDNYQITIRIDKKGDFL